MSAANIAAGENATFGLDDSVRRSGRVRPTHEAIARVARAIWPTKTDVELSIRTKTSDRRCRELLAGRSGVSLDAVANLLRSEEGEEFLIALLGDASPAWRRRLERSMEIAKLRHELEMQRNRIAELESAMGAID